MNINAYKYSKGKLINVFNSSASTITQALDLCRYYFQSNRSANELILIEEDSQQIVGLVNKEKHIIW